MSKKSIDTSLSRRKFMQFMAGLSFASTAGSLAVRHAHATPVTVPTGKSPPIRIKPADMTAAQRYQCRPDLQRFNGAHMAFKVISEELGAPAAAEAMPHQIMKNIKSGKIGKGVAAKNPAEARMFLALNTAANTWNMVVGPYGENLENRGFLGWQPQGLPPELTDNPLPLGAVPDMTNKIKTIAAYAGADKAGITKIDRRWVYSASCRNGEDPGPPRTKDIVFKKVDQPSETDSKLVLPDSVHYAIVMLFVQPRALNQIGPSTLATVTSVNQGYSQMGLAAVSLAQAIRSLGYVAIPCMNDTAMSVPLAIDAGLGELGRLGYLITPEYGPHVRIAKVLTNLPLIPDKPITFGVTDYCTDCGICARECPAGAISPDKERTFAPSPDAAPCGNPGSLKWFIDGKKCLRWWIESGAGCGRCMDVCPYTAATVGVVTGVDHTNPAAFWELAPTAYGRRGIKY